MEVAESMKAKRAKVSRPALMARINRKLAHEEQHLRASRSGGEKNNLGEFYIVDARRNLVVNSQLDPVMLARELGVLAAWEDAEGF
jgi:hypothetical protein